MVPKSTDPTLFVYGKKNFPFLKLEDARKEIIKNQLDILTENVSKELLIIV